MGIAGGVVERDARRGDLGADGYIFCGNLVGHDFYGSNCAVFVNFPFAPHADDFGDIHNRVAVQIEVAEEVDRDLAACLSNRPSVGYQLLRC